MPELISDGAEFSCPFCTGKLKLKVPSSGSQSDSKNLANQINALFPPPPGAQCTVIPSAPVPCTPAPTILDPGQSVVTIGGAIALGSGCKFLCAKGGLITLSSPGQSIAKHNEAGGAQNVEALNVALSAVAGITSSSANNETSQNNEKKQMKYEDASYHTSSGNQVKNPRPKNGQSALDNSVPIKATTDRRIGVDKKNNEIVVLDCTRSTPKGKLYHGHVREWNELTPKMQNALVKSKQTTPRGKIIK